MKEMLTKLGNHGVSSLLVQILNKIMNKFAKRFVMNSVISLHQKNIIRICGKFAQTKSAKSGDIKHPVLQIAKRLVKLFSKHQKEPQRSNIWFTAPAALQTGNIKAYAVS